MTSSIQINGDDVPLLFQPQMHAEAVFEAANVFDAKTIEWLAKQTNGFSGRDIFSLIQSLHMKKITSPNHLLTREIIQEVLNTFRSEKVIG